MTRDPKAWNRRLTHIVEQGFTVADAALWATALPGDRQRRAAEIAADYRDAGFTALEGVRWYDAVATLGRAVRFANAGWDPHHATLLRDRFRPSTWHRDDALTQDLIAEWLRSGIPPTWVIRYIDAGVPPRAASAIEVRRRDGDSVQPGLLLLVALGARTDDGGLPAAHR